MAKQKSHKGSRKVFRKRKSGSIKFKRAGGVHLTAKDTGKQVRQRRKKGTLTKADEKRVKDII